MVLLSTHTYVMVKKIISSYALLSGGLICPKAPLSHYSMITLFEAFEILLWKMKHLFIFIEFFQCLKVENDAMI